ncbi:MAG TPA: isoprenylcysteine carboxylmethyltransferase family protein [Acidobacteriaceae bacterium]|nr:isoprenylcysteine carboxylmethyltransferase family protein [Acidobacteriaceae bacterium]
MAAVTFALLHRIVIGLWLTIAAVWLVGAFTAKPAERRQSAGSRGLHMVFAIVAYVIGFSKGLEHTALARKFVPPSQVVVAVALLFVIAGIAFAIWARFALGRNWSGQVTIKQDHTLILRGPYTIVRNPIYSGLLLAMLGSAIAYREFRGLIALGLVLVLLLFKIRIEERFMSQRFGEQYAAYKRQVKALIPFVY